MSKHILFLIHGMGQHETRTWADPVIEKLTTVSERYPGFAARPLRERVEFIPVSYDDVITSAIKQWQANSQELAKFAQVNGLTDNTLIRVIDKLAEQNRPFFWSHLADVIVYRLLRGYTNLIRLSVIKQIAGTIIGRLQAGDDPRCSVLAHSLGTTVAHDALHILATEPWDDRPSPFGPKHWRFSRLFMFANTSALLASDYSPYDSVVRPGSHSDETSYFSTYFNANHLYDLPAQLVSLSPQWLVDKPDADICHVRDWNFHGLEHYLDNPRVHIPLLRGLTNHWVIPDDEAAGAVASYPQFAGTFEGIAQEVHVVTDRIQSLKNSPLDLSSMKQLLEALQSFFDELAALKTAVGEM